MCGIAGLWQRATGSADALRAQATAMADALAHRGPDDAGVWLEPDAGFALAHRRLAILELSPAGHQPMLSASGRFVIAFNGEIYNHRQLRDRLQRCGHAPSWQGHSDTETLLAAIEAWGLEESLRLCRGMFALALWDRRERQLLLARDRFGEKPLYWGWWPAGGAAPALVFGSDLVAFRALGGPPPPVEAEALAAFFRFGCIPAPLCIHAGLRQLPPGHLLVVPAGPDGGLEPLLRSEPPSPQAWWSVGQAAALAGAQPFIGEAEALEALEAALLQAVGEQAIADVPLGCFLSGGVDSSLITALLMCLSPQPVRSFTIAFPDLGGGEAGFDEAPWARAVASHLGSDHSEVALTAEDARALIPRLPRLWSEPFADSSQLPTHLVCREARRSGLTVALSGDGGDELFGGYNRHRLLPMLQARFGPLPVPLRRLLACVLELLPVSSRGLARDKRRKLAEALRCAGSLEALQASLTAVWPDPAALLSPAWSPAAAVAADAAISLPPAPSAAERLMLADVLTYLPTDILVKLDRAAMAVGLETRAPFLDPGVAAVAWRLPLAFKIRSASRPGSAPLGQPVGKWALRQLLARHLPAALIERPKAGFAMPIGPWLRGPLRPWAQELLDPQLLRRQGFLRPEPIQALWRQHLAGRADHSPRLWSVLMWQAWLQEWQG